MHSTAQRAAKLLSHKRVLVVGDSVSQQWANALLLDLRGRGFLPAAPSWNDTVSNIGLVPASRPFFQQHLAQRMYCDGLPTMTFRGGTGGRADSARGKVGAAHRWNESKQHAVHMVQQFSIHRAACNGHHAGCCQGSDPPLHALSKLLRSQQPHIVVANYGVHWHGEQLQGGEYYNHTAALLATLTEYAGERARDKVSAPLLLLRETFPQHFRGGSYDHTNREGGRGSGCVDVGYDPVRDGYGPAAFNQLAKAAVSASQAAGGAVRMYGRAFRALVPRRDAHPPAVLDCTHWCYSPLLWDPVLAPFYEEVVLRFDSTSA